MQRRVFTAGIMSVAAVPLWTQADETPGPVNDDEQSQAEFATFGAVHLNNTSLQRSHRFWTQIVGLECRASSKDMAEFGTDTSTLVVVHQAATEGFRSGYSGLYHFAIHAPDDRTFASMVHRLIAKNYRFSPTDHTMSKSVYLNDPDGITVEFTLETPERFRRVITRNGLMMEASDGSVRPPSAKLDVDDVLRALPDRDSDRAIIRGANIGHLHLYARNVIASNDFYKSLGFQQFNDLRQFQYADVGAGGAYKHRIAMNAWHGNDRPLAPDGSAGLRHFQIRFASLDRLQDAVSRADVDRSAENRFWVNDPTGNKILLSIETHAS